MNIKNNLVVNLLDQSKTITGVSNSCYMPKLPLLQGLMANFVYVSFDQDEKNDSTRNISNPENDKFRFIKLNWKSSSNNQFFFAVDNTKISIDDLSNGKIVDSLNSGFNTLALQDFDLLSRLKDQVNTLLSDPLLRDEILKDETNPINESLLQTITNQSSQQWTVPGSNGFSNITPIQLIEDSTFYCEFGAIDNNVESILAAVDFNINTYHTGASLSSVLKSDKTSTDSIIQPVRNPQKNLGTTLKSFVEVGVLIDKYKVNSGIPAYIKTFPFLKGTTEYRDYDVLYSSSYTYQARVVYAVNLSLPREDGTMGLPATYLFSSRPSPTKTVVCVEFDPPPPPVDLTFHYSREDKSLNIGWGMPVNRPRDIKSYAVFKRSSVYEPFQLLAYYDFNDAINRDSPPGWAVTSAVYNQSSFRNQKDLSGNLYQVKDPVLSHVDYEFSEKTPQIYAVQAFDAHNNSSTLSAQFEVTYDKNYRKINKRLVSHSGAEIFTPNLYLLQDLFSDTIYVESADSMEVVFDPAAPNGYRQSTSNQIGKDPLKDLYVYNPVNSLTSDKKYIISMINTDLQEWFPLEVRISK